MPKIEISTPRPYTGFGLSLLAHGFALFGVTVALPTPLPESPIGALAVTLTTPASPPAAPAPAPPPPTQPASKMSRQARPSPQPQPSRPNIVATRETPAALSTAPAPESAPALQSATGTNTIAAASSAPAPGEEVTPPRFEAAYLRNPAPAYPAQSRRVGEEGRVLLRVRVLANGQADEVVVHQSSRFERLDDAAVEAVRRWQFLPAKAGGVAIAAWVIVPIQFNLRGVG